jgi:hydrogenase nickel incorporation protein HypA/HybF
MSVHEMSVTQNVMEIVLQQAKEAGATRVKSVKLRFGTLTSIVPDCVAFYFEQMTPGTLAEGAKLDVEMVPLRLKCGQCGEEFEGQDELDVTCPKCGNPFTETLSGREMEVASIDVDT